MMCSSLVYSRTKSCNWSKCLCWLYLCNTWYCKYLVNSCCFLDWYGADQVFETLVTPFSVPCWSNKLGICILFPMPFSRLEDTLACNIIHLWTERSWDNVWTKTTLLLKENIMKRSCINSFDLLIIYDFFLSKWSHQFRSLWLSCSYGLIFKSYQFGCSIMMWLCFSYSFWDFYFEYLMENCSNK